ncbi:MULTISPECIES: multifunctional oxoglutarate decarboxylase/oxoglutarate dehydrogenase thiamine pyrophosphate-binding subunit/dihydrolipoyllysine-residue succinyltransferase subunit [unclassified Streptomyces]|uniref:multifunctional oxoglutarate decarboxylase/oxoglutarate dehydrogenase thiamine pyrophosphate-binding subunit/dihydrolipoyllysine-residue succinyltransferase subunit n=1 Tax=unclassified Streptomyces TaxID=2593676 RepID=UPI0022574921|nr:MULTISPECIES: multifunctional oxoglutarate decarboxylase/oxoglutarate dehydrogenase thiamine pyrophosphate-binding subunit/dihydrolipoyllysine-residue succinyltransferase subunit [unclassified Streptomyces]MCX4548247.1 multifunctional oxoglutarate decarboxylase/oxoglutarate dehydrogenase thiamine pyrophosphate-binding subunit/dihydrolipoyllysine-residue succinyltransferase subunit [Streptomyces sp. NBC_01500]WSC19897.1 multifunctional oxoglutarate decarboxylase/oxoglutarate dehydrogenase thiam
MSSQSPSNSSISTDQEGQGKSPADAFGPNEWLVDEIYQQYLQDPNSVDRAWWDFFADYKPGSAGAPTAGAEPVSASAPHQSSANGQSVAQGGAAAGAAATNAAPAPAAVQAPAAQPVAPAAPAAQPAPVVAKPAATAAAPSVPAAKPAAAKAPAEAEPAAEAPAGPELVTLRGPSAAVAKNMNASLELPTATSVRAVPVKLLFDNRIVINNHLKRARGGKISFTHLIGFAMVQALKAMPSMNHSFAVKDGKPTLVKPAHVNLGLAIDLVKPNGDRQLVVAAIKKAETLDFFEFWQAYEDIVRRARANKLTMDDFTGVTASLTNPGGIGTVHSVPRLMPGQGLIMGVGAMDYPAEFQGTSQDTLNKLGISKVMTLTSTYDHRVIQGAASGEFLRILANLLLGENGFYDDLFEALRIPYEPVRWLKDIDVSHDNDVTKAARVFELIHAYRVRGHVMADTDPLEYKQRKHPDLDIIEHGLTLWDLEREFAVGGFAGKSMMKLRDILGVLRDSYCRTTGVEFMHIQDPKQRKWIQDRIERGAHAKPEREEQLRILRRLNSAEAFETFLQTKYVGQKRFSLEGGESVIPLLDAVIDSAAESRLDEVVIGMAHRGRLNVLANIVGKSYAQIFREFEGNLDPKSMHGSGDVKYHLGSEGTFTGLDGEQIKVSLAANPSHLETVDPVVEGIARAKQDIINKGGTDFTVLPVALHGDAAFAGQGVVAETLNMSQLRGYRTGGTVHIVINNQVGFTAAPESSRSSMYATDVARMIEAPIFHVNGDDPEAVVRVARLAFEFRQAFNKDVVIDLICYRRRGHNEADNPSFTQPLMYDLIDKKRSVRKLYTESLIGRGDITLEEAEQALQDFQGQLEKVFAEVREATSEPAEVSVPVPQAEFPVAVDTAISQEVVKRIAESQVNIPDRITVHPRLLPQVQRRAAMIDDGTIDWAMGETLAIGSLLLEGTPVRLSGQDSRRGTFGQRHAVLIDRKTGEDFTPLLYLSDDQARYNVYDSLLSEYAVMGFEYGYSLARPESLVMWEAQFGDFVNGAQTVVDEYISAAEQKWGQTSGVTLLLPHGYEGQGPDHSSARPERFLQLCAQNNMTVAMPTLPSNYFHLLRWQVHNPHHKPLVVFTPKSMLRLKAAASKAEEFTTGGFRPVIGDDSVDPSAVRKVVFTAGKVYYDLDAERTKRGVTDTAIIRLERLYPLPGAELQAEIAKFPNAEKYLWAQEEPANQGAWPFIALNLIDHLDLAVGADVPHGERLRRISRPHGSSPAVGSAKRHQAEQAQLVAEVFEA